jgi:hypothetical protein
LARKIHVQLIDDLSREDAQETIRFSVEGTDYEIDLSADNAADLRETLKRYAAKGRRLRGPSRPTSGGAVSMSRDGPAKALKEVPAVVIVSGVPARPTVGPTRRAGRVDCHTSPFGATAGARRPRR